MPPLVAELFNTQSNGYLRRALLPTVRAYTSVVHYTYRYYGVQNGLTHTGLVKTLSLFEMNS